MDLMHHITAHMYSKIKPSWTCARGSVTLPSCGHRHGSGTSSADLYNSSRATWENEFRRYRQQHICPEDGRCFISQGSTVAPPI